MNFVIRELRSAETQAYLEIHRASVRGAVTSYALEVIDAWAPLPITQDAIAAAASNFDGEVRVAAVAEDRIIGVGSVVPRMSELRACYVLRGDCRQGVGAAIVKRLEDIARESGASSLTLDASLNAVSFYAGLGYERIEQSEHVLSGGLPIAM